MPHWFDISDSIPTITDWLTAIAALVGIPLSTYAFVKLIRKDEDRQAQIDRLTNIAGAQESQAAEMLKQTAVMVNQLEVMTKQNELLAQQIEVLRNTNLSRGNDGEAIAKLQAIEEQKLKLSVLPRLWLNGASYKGFNGQVSIELNNKGEVAHLDEFTVLSGPVVLTNQALPYSLEKGANRQIFLQYQEWGMLEQPEYQVQVRYHNAIGNPYHIVIQGRAAHAKIITEEAIA